MKSAFASMALLSAALLVLACNGKMGGSAPPPSETYDPGPVPVSSAPPASESQRTREMEAKQADLNQKAEAARTGTMTPEEIEQAYKDYEQERADLNRVGEAAAPPPADAPPAGDYPPPPL